MFNLFDQTRHTSAKEYVAYQVQVTNGHLLPLFRNLGVPLDRPILDIGCGKGGCILSLASTLDVPIHGIDIQAEDIKVARQAATDAGIENVSFEVMDITKDPFVGGKYALMLMRDVPEHIQKLDIALARLRPMLQDDGLLYVTFPPWRGPYSGHQHNAKSMVKFIPYLHAIAPKLFLSLIEHWESDRVEWLADERNICKNRLTRRKFEHLARESGWEIAYRQTYFLRPAFMRMGLPKLPNGFIGRLPLVGESLSTCCEYLLKPRH